MTQKSTIIAAAVLLVAGAAAVVLINNDDPAKPNAADTAANNRPQRPGSSDAGSGLDPKSANTARDRQRDPAENPEFVTKYGEARTNLSKHVATNVVGLLEDAIAMSEMATSGQLGGFGGGRMGIRAGLGGVYNQLNLTEDQQTRAAELYTEFQKREIERSKASVEKLKQDPTSLMQLMLASDAFKRGEITDEEFQALQTESGRELAGVMNPLDRNNFRGGQPLGDEDFVAGFQAILEPDQASTLQATLDQRTAEAEANNGIDPGNITNLPAMELEQLDRAVTSGKTVTSGLKQMMEGMGGLQDLAPLLEQQRQQQQPQDPPQGE